MPSYYLAGGQVAGHSLAGSQCGRPLLVALVADLYLAGGLCGWPSFSWRPVWQGTILLVALVADHYIAVGRCGRKLPSTLLVARVTGHYIAGGPCGRHTH